MLILIEKLRQLDNNILILIINDGSEKQFAYHFDHAAKQHQAHVISHAINIGKGAALKTGINFLLINYPENKNNCDS
jgi:glycosyltransferase involved in cell wall biosynthesis